MKFIAAVIKNNKEFRRVKHYTTLNGFKRGLKTQGCPYEVDENGLFYYPEGKLKQRSWDIGDKQYKAEVYVE